MRRRLAGAEHRRLHAAVCAALEDKVAPDAVDRLARVLWTITRIWVIQNDESFADAAVRFTRAGRHIERALEVLEPDEGRSGGRYYPSKAQYLLLNAAAHRIGWEHRWPNQAQALCDGLRSAHALIAASAAEAAGHRGPRSGPSHMELAAVAYCRIVPRGPARARATRGGPFHTVMSAVKLAATGRGLRWRDFLALPRK